MVVMTIFVEVVVEEVPCRRHPHHRGVVDIAGEVPDEEVDEGAYEYEDEDEQAEADEKTDAMGVGGESL